MIRVKLLAIPERRLNLSKLKPKPSEKVENRR